MLVPSPEYLQAQRAERRRAREARQGRIAQQRREHLVGELARTIRAAFEAGATSSLFGLEGPLRAGIRADLCLGGWGWESADLMAKDLISTAFLRLRAVRPSWNEGQPEWTIHEGLLIERTRCVRCRKKLPEGHHKFCSHLCAGGHHHRLVELRKGTEDTVVKIATGSLI